MEAQRSESLIFSAMKVVSAVYSEGFPGLWYLISEWRMSDIGREKASRQINQLKAWRNACTWYVAVINDLAGPWKCGETCKECFKMFLNLTSITNLRGGILLGYWKFSTYFKWWFEEFWLFLWVFVIEEAHHLSWIQFKGEAGKTVIQWSFFYFKFFTMNTYAFYNFLIHFIMEARK